MPSSYEIDKQRRLVLTTAWGACTADDVLRFRKQLLNDPAFDPSFSQLAAFPGVTKVNSTPDEGRILPPITPSPPQPPRPPAPHYPPRFRISRRSLIPST